MDNKKSKNIKYSSKIISATLLAPALTNVVAYASVTDYSIVDERTKLESSVNIAESFVNNLDLTDNEDRKILSKDLLKPALNAALIILNNEESSLEDVVKINSVLNKTLLFIQNTPTVKKSELELSSKLDNIKKFISEAEEANDINKYPVAAMELISQKVDYCEELLKDRLLSSDNSMNVAILSLNESVKDFKSAILLEDVNKDELDSVIEEGANFLHDVLIIGIRKGQYHKADTEAFDAILKKARAVNDDLFATNEDVSEAIQDLRDWMAKMPERQIKEDNILADKIKEVEDFLVDAIFGSDLGNYSDFTKVDFDRVLDEAKANVDREDVAGYRLYEMYENLIREFNLIKDTKVLEVDKTELNSLIEDCERLYSSIDVGEKPGQYYEADRNELRAEIDKAILVSQDKQAVLASVKSAHLALQTYRNGFSSKEITYESIKRVEIETVLAEARELYHSNVSNVGFDNGQYLASSLESLYDEIQKTDAINDNQTSSQKEIDTAKDTLSQSIDNFKNSLVTANKAELKTALNTALQTLGDTFEGTEAGQYPKEARERLQAAYELAKTKYETVHFEANQDEINTCASTLNGEIEIYLKSVIVKKDSLSTLIDEARALYDENLSNVGIDEGNYLEESISSFLKEIEKAEAVLNTENVSQENINLAEAELDKAISDFKNSAIKVDKSALRESLANAQNLIDTTKTGTNPGEYPLAQREELEKNFEYATLVYQTEHSNQDLISSAVTNLDKAILDYMDSVITEEDVDGEDSSGANPDLNYTSLNSSISKAEELLENPNVEILKQETDDLKKVLDNAKALKDSSEATQSDIDTARDNLEVAIKSFEDSQTKLITTHSLNLSNLIIDSKSLVDKYETAPPSVEDFDLVSRLLNTLKEYIVKAELVIEAETDIISEYIKAHDNLKLQKEIFYSLVYGSSEGNDGIVNDDNNQNNGNLEEEDTISEEERLLVEEYKEKINALLVEVKVALSTTEVGFGSNNCSENNKRATMYMYRLVESSVNECERIAETKALYNKINATLLDFTNRTISITDSGVVNGKNLTGIIKNLTVVPVGEVISYEEEFIPNAGMPIDVKAWMTAFGSSFMGLGMWFRRKK